MKSGVVSSDVDGLQGSALAAQESIPAPPPAAPHPSTLVWCCIAGLVLVGAIGMASILLKLWDLWTDDPLKSIGMLIVPVGVMLTLRVWRQCGWELRGSWWGLFPLVLALLCSAFRHSLEARVLAGPIGLNLLSPKVPLYLFGSGLVILFAGWRVWRRAWFPLALLLCAQPVPYRFLVYGDLPLQDLSAHIARSFAVLIGFPPTSKELLRLMFTPDFGMFIAPGCDGVRGALTMGYLALITGYLKKVSVPRWIAYTVGGVALGYIFNLIRLCALVLYYRIAVGHPGLEHFAKWADYILGGCLFLMATVLFLWMVSRKDPAIAPAAPTPPSPAVWTAQQRRQFVWRAVVCAVSSLVFIVPGIHAIRTWHESFSAQVHHGSITPAQLNALLPKQLGGYTLNRAWQENQNGQISLEMGAYERGERDEAILGVWLPTRAHNMHGSWMDRGEDPLQRHDETFLTGEGLAQFDTAFYSDGVTDSIAGNGYCTPATCIPSPARVPEGFTLTIDPTDFETRGTRAVSIFFRIDRPHAGDQPAAFRELASEAKEFVASIDFGEVSRRFQ